LEPLQLALSRRGAEARVHAMQAFPDAHLGQQVAVLQLDFGVSSCLAVCTKLWVLQVLNVVALVQHLSKH